MKPGYIDSFGYNMQMEQHLSDECPKEERQCRFPGCSFKVFVIMSETKR